MHVYKQKNPNGKPYKKWTVGFTDAFGKQRTLAAFTDKIASVEFGRMLEKLIIYRKSNTKINANIELCDWVNGLVPIMYNRLKDYGLINNVEQSIDNVEQPIDNVEQPIDNVEQPIDNVEINKSGKFLTTKELTKILGLGKTKIDTMRAEGHMPEPVKIGRAVRWRRSEIERWINDGCPTLHEWKENIDDTWDREKYKPIVEQPENQKKTCCPDCDAIRNQAKLIENLRARLQIETVKMRAILKIHNSGWDKIMTTGDE